MVGSLHVYSHRPWSHRPCPAR